MTSKKLEKNKTSMPSRISLSPIQMIAGVIVIILVSGLTAFYLSRGSGSVDASAGLKQFGKESLMAATGTAGTADTAEKASLALVSTYSNAQYGFSLKIPEGFKPRESKAGDTTTIVLENDKSEGVQLVITPYDEKDLQIVHGVKTLTKDMILKDIPDMQVTDEQPLEIGRNYAGLAFKSNNAAFDGSSREVWFVFKGHLFQISTYLKFDGLLRDMFTSWNFN
jgi:hypothetical protein